MDISKEETTPDQLMESFKGHGLKTIILFTVIVHLVVIGGSSIPYFIKKMGMGSAGEGKEAERLEAATREATSAIQEIAKKYGVKAEEVSDRFTGSKPAKAKPAEKKESEGGGNAEPEESPESKEPESEIEKEIKIKEEGPKLPGLGNETEDLFK